MGFKAVLKDGRTLEKVYYSLGGGFIATEDEPDPSTLKKTVTPYPCHSGADLARNCERLGLSVSGLTYVNEQAWRSREEIDALALLLWKEIRECIFRGVNHEGFLPGGLHVRRRAAEINRRLLGDAVYGSMGQWLELIKTQPRDFTRVNKWISCF
ncbi:partial L-serine dehydratase TdcG, partial [Anaerolineae bacterium]